MKKPKRKKNALALRAASMGSHVAQMDDKPAGLLATSDTHVRIPLRIDKSEPRYPRRLREHLGAHAPDFFAALGNV